MYFVFLIGLYSCSGPGKNQNSVQERKSVELEGCKEFGFKVLSGNDIWNWDKSKDLKKVDATYFAENLVQFQEFTYRKDYQTLFYNCKISLADGLVGQTIVQRIHNNEELNIFLLYPSKEGTNSANVFLLAKIQKSPDDMLSISTQFMDARHVKRTSVYIFSDEFNAYKDSVVSEFVFNNQVFVKSASDSIRIKL